MGNRCLVLSAVSLSVLAFTFPLSAQRAAFVPRASNLVIPQVRSHVIRPDRGAQAVNITAVDVGVVIIEQVAMTTMDISLYNPSPSQQQAEMLVPVPDGATVKGMDFQGAGKEPSAELLPRNRARAIYDSIVAKLKDPALVEFAGYNLIRTSVFPVPPKGTQKVRLKFEQILYADGNRVDYSLPRSESLAVAVPWNISVRIKSKQPIAATYSPSHKTETFRNGPGDVVVKVAADAVTEPGPFLLSSLSDAKSVAATLMAYPDPKIGGGYFLLLAASPSTERKDRPKEKREVTMVIDRSGSMTGEKMKQAKAAALQVLHGLEDGEAFNIMDYSTTVSGFANSPIIKNSKNVEEARHYIQRMEPRGGTNIHDALVEALRQRPTNGMLPLVLFLTDGIPTIGVRGEIGIRTAAIKANRHRRRIFTFGVGYDLNAPLLSHLSTNSRAMSTFVLPAEDVEVKISDVFRRLYGPVLSEPEIETFAEGAAGPRRISDPMPAQLPDLFEGDRLILLGKYREDRPIRFRLKGDSRGGRKTFEFKFEMSRATTRNSFVPRLWASRKIAFLIDQIRQAGAEENPGSSVIASTALSDPEMKELVDEIVRLSTEFGILTEYTSFLAREGTDLSIRDAILRAAGGNIVRRAQRDRSGKNAVNQAVNNDFQRHQAFNNIRNFYFDQNMERVQIRSVQQVNDRAFFQRGRRWVDSSLVSQKAAKADEVITVGSPAYLKLMNDLARQNRQGTLCMPGEILLRVGNRNLLVR
ncbi:MAG: VIT domain-containing protein [Planctomycetota bacterium]|nr:VIT domain-containing protein [Planctomycetota bacterium]